jgi:hypothetical protein
LQGQAVDVLHYIPTEALYEDTVEALEGLYGDHQMTAAYSSQLTDKSTRKSAAAMDQMARHAFVGLPQYHMRKEAARALMDEKKDREMKFSLFRVAADRWTTP